MKVYFEENGISFSDVNLIASPTVTLEYDVGNYVSSQDIFDTLASSNPFFGFNELDSPRSPSPRQLQYNFYLGEDESYLESLRSPSPDYCNKSISERMSHT